MEYRQDKETGLSSNNRSLLVALFTIVLLIWGPIDPYGMVVRIIYLVALPTVLWFSLGYFGKNWKADNQSNNRLARGIAGIIAGALFVGAYLSFAASYHTECTQSVRTRDGSECVGDYVSVPGRDISGTFIYVTLGAVATWYAISKHNDNDTSG
ncbi:hypothetical protein A3C59_05335 [Candidatus Daviesbacteria bacterium RIFCSPHIGHO2_02_FULL_36_13]|uniref:DUF5671 domain-containing protein n=1 Tax=Candidatus Daviesbacteria bacterium RIFCSPHIGHO2_02_FULL_36_13 TaxID=1797768 RepID=A0A1F5JSC5_9BACT|nr:MAG: hypothetical protein A3C59_05335 [Candidatus Daviesbacteria bacterium RIFCSPHIGHO2_02_FULL_36_13]